MDTPQTIRGHNERAKAIDLRAPGAGFDDLTGLLTRQGIVERIAAEQSTLAPGAGVAVLALDIDDYLAISYLLGPAESDALLVELAGRLRRLAGERPLARIDTDVFMVLVPDAADVDRLMREVRATLDRPFAVRGHRIYLTVAAGGTYGDAGADPSALLAQAGTASLAARRHGRSSWALYEPVQRQAAIDRLDAEEELHRAFQRQDLSVHFQPIVDLASGEIGGAEALMRWEKDDQPVHPPPSFIDVAERCGLILPIGVWVMGFALRQLAGWQTAVGNRRLRVNLNLSAHQLAQPTLVDDLWAAMIATGISPSQVEAEITETVLLRDLETTNLLLTRLRSMGVRIAVDDFGTGYASLSYLRQFPVDALKIDREFVAGIGERQQDDVIVEAVIRLAHDLGLEVVAEGVETQAQLDRLRELGCQKAQGHLIAPAMPSDRLLELLGDRPTW